MLAAVENLLPPATDGLARALAILERGLVAQPDSLDLVRAKYRVLRATRDPKAAIAFVKAKAEGDKGPSAACSSRSIASRASSPRRKRSSASSAPSTRRTRNWPPTSSGSSRCRRSTRPSGTTARGSGR